MKRVLLYVAATCLLAAPLTLVQCSSEPSDVSTFPGGGTGDGGGSSGGGASAGGATAGNGPPDFGACDGGACSDVVTPPAATCGDGTLSDTEACDDGNARPGDGCSATCTLEPGWACPVVGIRCEAAKCGDGIVAGLEECELPDGGAVTGCSATCRVAPGYDCDPVALTCALTVCGDGKVSRGEGCEDGNTLPFDGCFKCQKEPVCTGGVCQATCGDAQRFASEECDDGNARAGDGCSIACKSETGYVCTDIVGTPPPVIDLPVIVRDFIGQGNALDGGVAHIDFNRLGGSGVLGIVEPQLGAGGRPIFACPAVDGGVPDCTKNPGHLFQNGGDNRPNMSTKENFAQWYTDVPAVNRTSVLTVPLKRQANGTYLWDSADAASNGGRNFFDPVHDAGWVALGKERQVCDPARNVSFTSETHFWFEYQGGERFEFAGDDDTWVFVNGKLVIDLGGLHVARAGNFVLDADTDQAGVDTADGSAQATSDLQPTTRRLPLGLTPGGVYDVVMFQAERNECGSNFKVTLKDFNRPKSACASACGDAVVASDEACDDGVNDGSYGRCMPGCKARGPRCGDGKVAPTKEECDDGNTENNDGCTNGCIVRRVQ